MPPPAGRREANEAAEGDADGGVVRRQQEVETIYLRVLYIFPLASLTQSCTVLIRRYCSSRDANNYVGLSRDLGLLQAAKIRTPVCSLAEEQTAHLYPRVQRHVGSTGLLSQRLLSHLHHESRSRQGIQCTTMYHWIDSLSSYSVRKGEGVQLHTVSSRGIKWQRESAESTWRSVRQGLPPKSCKLREGSWSASKYASVGGCTYQDEGQAYYLNIVCVQDSRGPRVHRIPRTPLRWRSR